jgi:hypothetical protein
LSVRLASSIEAQVRTALRILTVTIALASWLAISNHCAFAAVALRSQRTNSECPFHSKPAKPENVPSGIQCCKILRATTTAPAKTVDPKHLDLTRVDFAAVKTAVLPPVGISSPLDALDTGPPGTTAFAELIGSVQAHAPPSLA